MISVRTLLLAPIWGIGLVVGFVFLRLNGPDLEESLFPVITGQEIVETWRTPTQACFRWRYTKARDVRFIRQVFVLERPDGVRFPTTAIRADLGIPINETTTAPAGETRTIPYCADVPTAVREEPRFVLAGRNVYRSSTQLWDVEQPFLPVTYRGP